MKRKMIAMITGAAVAASTLWGASIFAQQSGTSQTAAEKKAVLTDEDIFSPISTVNLTMAEQTESSDFTYSNIADLAEAVMPSIVAITTTSVQQVRNFFYGRTYAYESQGAGSGIIVGSNDTELLICSNNHVVEGASDLTVTFINEESYPAVIKGTDPANDLAVVAVSLDDIPKDTMDQIKIAQMGNSDEMRVGEQVVAIGNALGYGQSVTTGIISAKDRTIQAGSSQSPYSYGEEADTYENLIQTDAAINPGNSGGALLNMNGELIGINSAKASRSGVEGMGYAIPISKAMPILEDLMNRKTRTLVDEENIGYLGIQGQSVSRDAILLYGIPAGIYVTYVYPDGAAEEAGMAESDILTSFDGETITGMEDLQDLLRYYEAGETVNVTVYTNDDGAYVEKELTDRKSVV